MPNFHGLFSLLFHGVNKTRVSSAPGKKERKKKNLVKVTQLARHALLHIGFWSTHLFILKKVNYSRYVT